MPYKLLLADDSVTIQRVIELTFADEDIEVATCGDGQEAVERIASDRPDIVLADAGMPKRDGFEVARYVKDTPELRHIPVLLLTGAFDPVDEARVKSAGCDGVLAKPFEPQLVITRVREILKSTGATPRPASGQVRPVTSDRLRPVSGPAIDLPGETVGRLTAPPPAPQEQDPKESRGEPRGRPSIDSLDDYFDRLDAAFAAETASERSRVPSGEPEDTTPGNGFTDLSDIVPPPRQTAALPGRGSEPSHAVVPPLLPAPVSPPPSQTPAPPANSETLPTQRPALADAFASVLAAEQGRPGAPLSFALQAPPVIGDDVIERIASRVLERLSDRIVRETTADVVSRVAERLVREEIDRIKAAAR